MELHEQHCWEYKGVQLVPAEDPITGDGGVDERIRAAGYAREITSIFDDSHSGADVTVYKNTSSANGNPLFYIDVMGDKTGLAALIAHDFQHLMQTLNHLYGLLSLIRMDQSSGIGNLTVRSSIPKP